MNSRVLRFLFDVSRLPVLIFSVHSVLSLGFNAYDKLSWMDVAMHLVGGIVIAHFFDRALEFSHKEDLTSVARHTDRMLMIFGLVAVAVVFWEFGEFLADAFFNAGAQRSIANTMKDQFFGLLGGALYLAARSS